MEPVDMKQYNTQINDWTKDAVETNMEAIKSNQDTIKEQWKIQMESKTEEENKDIKEHMERLQIKALQRPNLTEPDKAAIANMTLLPDAETIVGGYTSYIGIIGNTLRYKAYRKFITKRARKNVAGDSDSTIEVNKPRQMKIRADKALALSQKYSAGYGSYTTIVNSEDMQKEKHEKKLQLEEAISDIDWFPRWICVDTDVGFLPPKYVYSQYGQDKQVDGLEQWVKDKKISIMMVNALTAFIGVPDYDIPKVVFRKHKIRFLKTDLRAGKH